MIRSFAVAGCLLLAGPAMAQEVNPAEVAYMRTHQAAELQAQVDSIQNQITPAMEELITLLPPDTHADARRSLARFMGATQGRLTDAMITVLSQELTMAEIQGGYATAERQAEAIDNMYDAGLALGERYAIDAVNHICRELGARAATECGAIKDAMAELAAT